jgi:hypothetical protein
MLLVSLNFHEPFNETSLFHGSFRQRCGHNGVQEYAYPSLLENFRVLPAKICIFIEKSRL